MANHAVVLRILVGASMASPAFSQTDNVLNEDKMSLLQQSIQISTQARTKSHPFISLHSASEVKPNTSKQGQRLHIVSVTGMGKYENLSIISQDSWGQTLGETDNFTNVCDVGCGRVMWQGQRLEHILPMGDDAFPDGNCTYDGAPCDGYTRASFKYVWGFIHEYRRLASSGDPMPRWWLIKDDDTFVNLDRLMDVAERYDHTERLLLGNVVKTSWAAISGEDIGKKQISASDWFMTGGSGWLASAAMAEQLVIEHGTQWLAWQDELIKQLGPNAVYDVGMPSIVDLVEDAEVLDFGGHNGDEKIFLGRSDSVYCGTPAASAVHMKALGAVPPVEDPVEFTDLAKDCVGLGGGAAVSGLSYTLHSMTF